MPSLNIVQSEATGDGDESRCSGCSSLRASLGEYKRRFFEEKERCRELQGRVAELERQLGLRGEEDGSGGADEGPEAEAEIRHREKKRGGSGDMVASLPSAKRARSTRCGSCEGCSRDDNCGKCINCLDMPMFGGPHNRKQACLIRRCTSMLSPNQRSTREKEGGDITAQKPVPSAIGSSSSAMTAAQQTRDKKLEELRAFKQTNGHLNIPRDHELWSWMRKQQKDREMAQRGVVPSWTAEREQQLTELGFGWNLQTLQEVEWEKVWRDNFEKLRTYKALYGTLDDPSLKQWMDSQRSAYKKGERGERTTFPEHRKLLVEELGFVWNPVHLHEEVHGPGSAGELFSSANEMGAAEAAAMAEPTSLLGLRVPSAGPTRKRVKNSADDPSPYDHTQSTPLDSILDTVSSAHTQRMHSSVDDSILHIDASAHTQEMHPSGDVQDEGGLAGTSSASATSIEPIHIFTGARSLVPHLPPIEVPSPSSSSASASPGDAPLLLLSHPEDGDWLTALLCFIRSQIEVFEATPDDVAARSRRGGIKEPIAVGRVGIRCIHCTHILADGRAKGAVSYPHAIDVVHQSVRNWQRYHFDACPYISKELKEQCRNIKTKRSHSNSSSKAYWVRSCKRMGMVDTDKDNGIRLVRPGDDDGGGGVDADAPVHGSAGHAAPPASETPTGGVFAAVDYPSPAALRPPAPAFAAASRGVPSTTSAGGSLYPNIAALSTGKYGGGVGGNVRWG